VSAKLTAAYEAVGLGDLGRTLAARLDSYAVDWAAAHRDACRATRVVRSQTEAMLDRRNLCLDRARDRLDAVAQKLASVGDRDVAQAAPSAVALLPDLAPCADVESLAAQTPLPADPAARAKVEDAAKQVSDALMTVYDDWDKDPLGVAERALAVAKDAGWPPLIAEAARARGQALSRLTRTHDAIAGFEEAFDAAIDGGDDVLAGWVAADLANVYAADSPEDADRWLGICRGFWDRVRKPDDLGAYLERAAAERAIASGDTAAGVAATREANAMTERDHPDPLDLADDHRDLAHALLMDGKIDDAKTENDAALVLAVPGYGDHNPYVAGLRARGSEIARVAGRLDDAIALGKRALEDMTAWYGADAPATGQVLFVLGSAESLRGDDDAAVTDLGRAFAIAQKIAPGTIDIAEDEANLAMAEIGAARYPSAVAHAREALAAMEKIQGADSPSLDPALVILGGAERGAGDLDDSERELRRALALDTTAHGANDPRDADTAVELSYTLVLHQKSREAAELLAAYCKDGTEPPVAAECHTAIADALWVSGGDHARARAEASAGRDAYAKLGDAFTKQVAKADAWLAAHSQ
jgi:tetratricopeptide (TPR) repeat protein